MPNLPSYQMTGFQSPCAEYAEEILSLDERYLTHRPATFMIEAKGDAKELGIRSGDRLIIDRSLNPVEGRLVLMVIQNEFVLRKFSQHLLKNQDPENGDFVWGVVTTLFREFR